VFTHIRKIQGLLAVAGALAASGAVAAERTWTVQGTELRITSPCAKTISIEPASGLAGQVQVEATSAHPEEIDQLAVSGGSVASISKTGQNCWNPAPHVEIGNVHIGVSSDPTLALTVRVPAGMALAIKEGGIGEYHIGAVGGSLHLDLTGSGSVDAEEAKDFNLSISGSGDARLGSVGGRLDGRISGSGSLTVAKAVLSSTDLKITGSGDVTIDEGTLGALTLAVHGSGDVKGPAATGVHYEGTGSGKLFLRSVSAASVSVKVSGNGDVSLGDGTIGTLTVLSSGSSDIRVAASVTDADLTVRGSGDVTVDRVTGQLNRVEKGSGTIKIHNR